jgi:hypothetical protein
MIDEMHCSTAPVSTSIAPPSNPAVAEDTLLYSRTTRAPAAASIDPLYANATYIVSCTKKQRKQYKSSKTTVAS